MSAEIGLTPKAAARVIRFSRARQLLVRRVFAADRRMVAAARDPEGNRWSFGTYRGEPRKG